MYGVYRVHGRRPVRRPRGTWLESANADMAEVEIDEEDVQKEIRRQHTGNHKSLYPVGLPCDVISRIPNELTILIGHLRFDVDLI